MRQSKSYPLFCRCFLFAGLPEEQVSRFWQLLDRQDFPREAVIYDEGHFRRAIGFVLSGKVAVLKPGGLLLNRLQPGDCFGAAAMFSPIAEYVTTIRAESACTIGFLDEGQLTAIFREAPQVAINYITFLSGRIQFLNRKIDSFTQSSTEQTLSHWLQSHAGAGGQVVVQGGLSQLARQLHMGRASLYRGLDAMESRGEIAREGNHITLLNPERFKIE